MRLQLTDKASTVALVLTLCRQFRGRSVELRQICNGAKSGITAEVRKIFIDRNPESLPAGPASPKKSCTMKYCDEPSVA